MTGDLHGSLLSLMSASSWLVFVDEVKLLIDESTKGVAYQKALEVCPSLEESVSFLRRQLDDMGETLVVELAREMMRLEEEVGE